MHNVMTDHEVAQALAASAGALLLELRLVLDNPDELKREGDRRSHDLLMAEWSRLRTADAVLSEEGVDHEDRGRASRVWIVDPLDGIREFSEKPRTDCAVHVALWVNGELTAGAVARPAMGSKLSTANPRPVPAFDDRPLRIAVSRSRPPAFVERLAKRLGAALVPMGSAGVKATEVLDGAVDAYVHAGGQYEWESAAPVAVVVAAGRHASRIDGSALAYNQPDPLLPDLLICRPEHAEQLLEAIATLTTEDVAP